MVMIHLLEEERGKKKEKRKRKKRRVTLEKETRLAVPGQH